MMSLIVTFTAALLAGYLLGSLSSAILVCRLLGRGDPREVGSRNPGATNVLRSFGKTAAAATLAGDIAKGFVPVFVATLLGLPPPVLAAAGIGAFVGHLFPLFFGFRGGKGVATYVGVICALDPRLGLVFGVVWLGVAALARYSSLAALTASLLVPCAAAIMGSPPIVVAALALMTVAVFWRHTANIRKLLAGTESRIGQRRA